MKHIKRTLTLLLVIALLATTALFFASCGDKSGLDFILNKDEKSYSCTGFKDGKEAAEAIIPATYKDLPVTAISGNAFSNNLTLTSVTIPDSVTKIGNYAFLSCTSLTSVTIPNSVTELGMEAFCKCTGLTSVTLSSGLTEIPNSSFYGCSKLTSVTIPEGITTIEISAFGKCAALTEVVIPDGVTKIGYDSFAGCSTLKKVTLPDTLEDWYRTAFEGCALEYETYENGKYIGNWLFYVTDKEKVTEFKLKEGTVGIMESAFAGGKNLTGTVVIPDTVKIISDGAFANCTRVNAYNIPASVKYMGHNVFEGWYYTDTTDQDKTLVINCEASAEPEEWNDNWIRYPYMGENPCTINWGK